jgi:hypothetical protein
MVSDVPTPVPPVFQYAYFVTDLEAAIHEWSTLSGAGPFFVTEHHKADRFMYRGTATEADVSYAFGYSGASQIQLIAQHDDQPSIYRDMYPDGGGGFHHVAMLVVDYSGQRQRLADAGLELACELHANDIDACYFDARHRTGGFIELHSHTPRIANTFDRWHQAHLDWDGTGSPIRRHISGT